MVAGKGKSRVACCGNCYLSRCHPHGLEKFSAFAIVAANDSLHEQSASMLPPEYLTAD
jgi:hypothetical protein